MNAIKLKFMKPEKIYKYSSIIPQDGYENIYMHLIILLLRTAT